MQTGNVESHGRNQFWTPANISTTQALISNALKNIVVDGNGDSLFEVNENVIEPIEDIPIRASNFKITSEDSEIAEDNTNAVNKHYLDTRISALDDRYINVDEPVSLLKRTETLTIPNKTGLTVASGSNKYSDYTDAINLITEPGTYSFTYSCKVTHTITDNEDSSYFNNMSAKTYRNSAIDNMTGGEITIANNKISQTFNRTLNLTYSSSTTVQFKFTIKSSSSEIDRTFDIEDASIQYSVNTDLSKYNNKYTPVDLAKNVEKIEWTYTQSSVPHTCTVNTGGSVLKFNTDGELNAYVNCDSGSLAAKKIYSTGPMYYGYVITSNGGTTGDPDKWTSQVDNIATTNYERYREIPPYSTASKFNLLPSLQYLENEYWSKLEDTVSNKAWTLSVSNTNSNTLNYSLSQSTALNDIKGYYYAVGNSTISLTKDITYKYTIDFKFNHVISDSETSSYFDNLTFVIATSSTLWPTKVIKETVQSTTEDETTTLSQTVHLTGVYTPTSNVSNAPLRVYAYSNYTDSARTFTMTDIAYNKYVAEDFDISMLNKIEWTYNNNTYSLVPTQNFLQLKQGDTVKGIISSDASAVLRYIYANNELRFGRKLNSVGTGAETDSTKWNSSLVNIANSTYYANRSSTPYSSVSDLDTLVPSFKVLDDNYLTMNSSDNLRRIAWDGYALYLQTRAATTDSWTNKIRINANTPSANASLSVKTIYINNTASNSGDYVNSILTSSSSASSSNNAIATGGYVNERYYDKLQSDTKYLSQTGASGLYYTKTDCDLMYPRKDGIINAANNVMEGYDVSLASSYVFNSSQGYDKTIISKTFASTGIVSLSYSIYFKINTTSITPSLGIYVKRGDETNYYFPIYGDGETLTHIKTENGEKYYVLERYTQFTTESVNVVFALRNTSDPRQDYTMTIINDDAEHPTSFNIKGSIPGNIIVTNLDNYYTKTQCDSNFIGQSTLNNYVQKTQIGSRRAFLCTSMTEEDFTFSNYKWTSYANFTNYYSTTNPQMIQISFTGYIRFTGGSPNNYNIRPEITLQGYRSSWEWIANCAPSYRYGADVNSSTYGLAFAVNGYYGLSGNTYNRFRIKTILIDESSTASQNSIAAVYVTIYVVEVSGMSTSAITISTV